MNNPQVHSWHRQPFPCFTPPSFLKRGKRKEKQKNSVHCSCIDTIQVVRLRILILFALACKFKLGWQPQFHMVQVCAPSCHDCSTMRAWWEEDEQRRCRFFKNVVGSDALPPSQCVPDIAYFIIREHVEAPSMWAIFPLQVLCQNLVA